MTEGSLLKLVGTDAVQKTTLTRKVTYGGKTVVYPVYRVRLDALYYNDQNDRIATWITRYVSENGQEALSGLNIEIYNRIIENFMEVDSRQFGRMNMEEKETLKAELDELAKIVDGFRKLL